MELQGMWPDVIDYDALISTGEKCKQPEPALEVCEAMKWQDMLLAVMAYSALLSACGKGK